MSWKEEIKKEDTFSTDGQKMQLIIEELEFKLRDWKLRNEDDERINYNHVVGRMEKAIRFAKEMQERLR